MKKNKVCYWEINAKDGPALVEFYRKLFDWEQRYDEATDFFELGTGNGKDGGIGGGIFTGKGRLPTHRCLYIEVEDIKLTCEKAGELGREILQGPFELAKVGHLAFFEDPEGHMIGLIQRVQGGGDPD